MKKPSVVLLAVLATTAIGVLATSLIGRESAAQKWQAFCQERGPNHGFFGPTRSTYREAQEDARKHEATYGHSAGVLEVSGRSAEMAQYAKGTAQACPCSHSERSAYSWEGSCEVKCTDGQCRFVCSTGIVYSTSDFEARLQAESRLRSQAQGQGAVIEGTVRIEVKKRF